MWGSFSQAALFSDSFFMNNWIPALWGTERHILISILQMRDLDIPYEPRLREGLFSMYFPWVLSWPALETFGEQISLGEGQAPTYTKNQRWRSKVKIILLFVTAKNIWYKFLFQALSFLSAGCLLKNLNKTDPFSIPHTHSWFGTQHWMKATISLIKILL